MTGTSIRFANALTFIARGAPARPPRVVLWTVCALFAVMLVWSVWAKLDIVAVAEGRLVPATLSKIVQPLEGGVVRDILVQEGDAVAQGQVLIRLDATVAGAETRSLAGEIALRRLTLRRIDSQLAGRPVLMQAGDDPALLLQVQAQAAARQQALQDLLAQEGATRDRLQHDLRAAMETLDKLKATTPLAEQAAEAFDKLVQAGFVSEMGAHDKQRDALEKRGELKSQIAAVQALAAALSAQDKRVAQLASQERSQLQSERTQALAELAKLEQDAAKQEFRQTMLELRAPQAGIVKDLATTTRGAVVQPGTVLMNILPKDDPLVAEVRIRNEDIGFVQEGEEVTLKLAAYAFQKYGMVPGRVKAVAPDVSTPSRGVEPTASSQADFGFKAMVELRTQHLDARGMRLPLSAGMQVSAEIRQGERTVLEYLLSPVQGTVLSAARER